MLELLIRFLRWNMRLWYAVLRLLGRLTGQEDRVETWIELTGEKPQDSFDTLKNTVESNFIEYSLPNTRCHLSIRK
jgi:hypothetical protein